MRRATDRCTSAKVHSNIVLTLLNDHRDSSYRKTNISKQKYVSVGMPLKLFNISVAQGTGSRRARLLVYKQRKFYLETSYEPSLSQPGEACQPY